MELKKLDYAMTVCKVASELDIDLNKEFYFIGKTDEEYSLVCITEDTPINTIERRWVERFQNTGSVKFFIDWNFI